ncbi:heat shock protein [Salsuginibacillus halophilus]|uniref:Protease HtpX homolog n=1 Tax=Salsuginibacillus halophilus TaxID=517424 RepID=A0A2P8HW73_9BACI|nr:protease HtpX [Salsuginibacillus halophilus]PSL50425.1 heat shock protein [Salsuginibacillus halophilus]
MGKRILLLVVTNVFVLLTIMIVWGLILAFTDIDGSFQTDTTGGLATIEYMNLFVFSLVVGFAGSFISLAMSRFIAKKVHKVKVLNPEDNLSRAEQAVVDKVHRNARAAGMMHMPEVGIYQSNEVNAFATGPTKKRSLVAVSSGLLQSMDDDAVEGVIAHEVAHVSNGDMVTMTLLQGVVNTFVVFFSRIAAILVSRLVRSEMQTMVRFLSAIVFQILFSILGSIVVMWFSRYREYRADQGGADLAGKDKMAHALRSLQQHVNRVDDSDEAVQTLKINNKRSMAQMFSSHPPLEERIRRLEAR